MLGSEFVQLAAIGLLWQRGSQDGVEKRKQLTVWFTAQIERYAKGERTSARDVTLIAVWKGNYICFRARE